MSSSLAVRGAAALTALASAVLLLAFVAQGHAEAATVAKGSAVLNLNTGKVGNASAVAPAKGSKAGRKGVRATAPVKSLSIIGSTAKVGLGGGVRFKNGKRQVSITGLSLSAQGNLTVVRGKLAGRNLVLMTARGKSTVDSTTGVAKLKAAKLSFPASVSRTIKNRLKLKKAPAGVVGSLTLNAYLDDTTPVDPCEQNPSLPECQPDPCELNPDAQGCPITDPYLTQCNVAATSKVTGTLPAAAALPTLTDPKTISGLTTVPWGIKTSFRNYVVSPATNGSIHASDGATTTGSAPAFSGFDWSFVDGQYSDGGTPNDPADDRAILNLNGTVVLCATGHNFRVAISDPTVVLDGTNSRIVADVDANLDGKWIPTQRVDLATLDAASVTPQLLSSSQGAKWTSIPATLTETGGKAICGDGQPLCPYTTGTAMDAITIETPAGALVDQYNSQCGVAASSRVTGGWSSAASEPNLADSKPIVGPANFDWGFKSGFQTYVSGPPSGSIQGLDGATFASSEFTFDSEGGDYSANDPEDMSDDQAIIHGSGTALFCKPGHFFWVSISDPTIIIDGDDSRITADLSSNEGGVWKTPVRVNLADLDVSGITPFYNKSGSEVDWGSVPATLNADVAPFGGFYQAGDPLDSIDVLVKTAYDTGAGDAAAWDALATYVQANLAFPLADPAEGGCTLPVPTGGSASQARTNDEGLSYNPSSTLGVWVPGASHASALPNMGGAVDLEGGRFDWGVRRGLRSTVNGTGEFNLSGDVSASNPYFGTGVGGSSSPADRQMGNTAGTTSKPFYWALTSGSYKANSAGHADDQVVFRSNGRVAFCQTGTSQWYGAVFSNPTVVIDGANSRVVMDVATRYRLSWVRGRVDLAKLDLTGVTPTETTAAGITTLSWTLPDEVSGVGPVKLTKDGEAVLKMLGAGTYNENLGLDGLTLKASFPE